MHYASPAKEDFICFMELGLDSGIHSRICRREGSVLVTSPEIAEVRGNITFHTSRKKNRTSVPDRTLSMVDNYTGPRLNQNVIPEIIQGVRECVADGGIKVIWIKKSRKFVAGVAKGVNDRMDRPQDPPWKSTNVIMTWSNIKVG